MLNQREEQYVWMLEDSQLIHVFVGFDHVRRVGNTYTSRNKTKMLGLARSIASSKHLELVHENREVKH